MSDPGPLASVDAAALGPPPLADRDYRPIPGWPDYVACDAGFVWRRTGRHHAGQTAPIADDPAAYRLLKAQLGAGGYLMVHLYNGGRANHKSFRVHTLVLNAYLGPPLPGQQVRHLNNDPGDNRPANLVWGTAAENAQDKVSNGTHPRGGSHANAKLTEKDVLKILELAAAGVLQRAIAERFRVSKATINRIVRGDRWQHVTRIAPLDADKLRHEARPRGTTHANAKLSEDDVRKIRELRAAGVLLRVIAERFGISLYSISGIVYGRTWKHVPR